MGWSTGGAITPRFVYLSALDLKLDGAAVTNIGASPNLTGTNTLADGSTTGVFGAFIMPANAAAAAAVTVRPFWAPALTDGAAHTVRWQMVIAKINAGTDATAAGTTVTWTGDSAARTASVTVLETGQVSTGVSPSAGDFVRFTLQRVGADAADSYVGNVNLIGIRIEYTSTA